MPSVLAAFVAVIAVLAAFVFTSHGTFGAVVTVFAWGVVVFALVPLLQLRVVDTAADAPNLASTLNQGAFNLGNATGAWLGGAAITLGVGYGELPVIGALIALAALGLAVVSVALQRSAPDAQENRAAA
jgi:MFS transporter, DHA1 family, inner membrane transport protein